MGHQCHSSNSLQPAPNVPGKRLGASWLYGLSNIVFFFTALLLVVSVANTQAKPFHDLSHPIKQAFIGEAYAQDGKNLLYREYHVLFGDAQVESGFVEYRFPDGSLKARKDLDFGTGSSTPSYVLQDKQFDYQERVTVGAANIAVALRGMGLDASESLDLLPGKSVIDAGFDAFVQAHWLALISGAQQGFAFLSPTRQQKVELRLRLNTLTERLAEIYVEPQSFWLRFLLEPIVLHYDVQKRRLEQYQGLTNIMQDASGNYVADIRYTYPEPGESSEEFVAKHFHHTLALKAK